MKEYLILIRFNSIGYHHKLTAGEFMHIFYTIALTAVPGGNFWRF
jgi:hypothetical protein